MKSDVMPPRAFVEPAILRNLVAEVKETVAMDVEMVKNRKNSFGTVHMWNMRRKSRFAVHPRKRPTIVTGFGY